MAPILDQKAQSSQQISQPWRRALQATEHRHLTDGNS